MNSRALFQQLEQELGRCRRERTCLTVLLCDLDHFKTVNDQFGHVEGNKLLQALAAALKRTCREYDCLARMGGDEFVILAPGADRAELKERIIAAAASVEHEAGHTAVAVSVGSAVYPIDGETAEQLLTEADHRMYRSKREKRVSPGRQIPLAREAAHA